MGVRCLLPAGGLLPEPGYRGQWRGDIGGDSRNSRGKGDSMEFMGKGDSREIMGIRDSRGKGDSGGDTFDRRTSTCGQIWQ